MLRDKKGISLITAVMTVLIIIIILSTITYTAINNTKVKKINEFYSDLRVITDEVQLYYAEHDKLPVDDIFYTVTESYIQKEVNGVFEAYSSLKSANIDFILKDGKTDYSFENLYNPNDYDTSGDIPKSVYYQIDLSKFDNLTLSNPDCTYLVNEQSKTVYCYEGVKVNGEIHHKLPLDYIDAVPTFALVFMLAGSDTVYLSKEKATAVYYPTENPTKEGYNFTGWYYDEECTQKAQEGNILKEDTTLYAGWVDPTLVPEPEEKDMIEFQCVGFFTSDNKMQTLTVKRGTTWGEFVADTELNTAGLYLWNEAVLLGTPPGPTASTIPAYISICEPGADETDAFIFIEEEIKEGVMYMAYPMTTTSGNRGIWLNWFQDANAKRNTAN